MTYIKNLKKSDGGYTERVKTIKDKDGIEVNTNEIVINPLVKNFSIRSEDPAAGIVTYIDLDVKQAEESRQHAERNKKDDTVFTPELT